MTKKEKLKNVEYTGNLLRCSEVMCSCLSSLLGSEYFSNLVPNYVTLKSTYVALNTAVERFNDDVTEQVDENQLSIDLDI